MPTLTGDARRGLEIAMGVVLAAAVATYLDAQAAEATALGAEDTDVQIPLDILAGTADAGTWTKAITSAGAVTVTRTAAGATEGFWVPCNEAIRTASGRGLKITGIRCVYTVGTADATDVRTELYSLVTPADNSATAAATLLDGAAADNAHYDAAHDTAAERGDDTAAPEKHTSTLTVLTPAYAVTGVYYFVKFVVVDPGTSVVVLKSITLLCSQRLVDLA